MAESRRDLRSHVVRSCEVPAAKADVWRFCTTPADINHELMPIVRLRIPAAFRNRTVDDVEPGEHVGRVWLLLGGFLPVEYDNMTIAEIDPGERFLEQSSMASLRVWQHERTLKAIGDHCTLVTDTLEFVPRFPLPGLRRLATTLVGLLFDHRHRRLVAHFTTS